MTDYGDKTMKTLYLAGAALAFAAVPAAADHHGQETPAVETQATTATPAPRFVRSEVTQTTPADYKSAEGEDLPICSEGQTDGCINSWEANKTGNRPLEYWPGRPASEIEGSLPATKAEFDSMNKDDADDSEEPE